MMQKKWFQNCIKNKNLVEQIKNIKLIVTDIDGALTNGQIFIGENKQNMGKNFSTQDGFIIDRILQNNLLSIAFLSGRNDNSAKIRANMLGIKNDMCHLGFCGSKIEKLIEIQKNNNLTKEETLYFGDDFLDFELKPYVGLFVCPSNTPFYFQEHADIQVPIDGGNSAFRLLLDLILFAQEKHPFAKKYIENALK
ncbi:KdsC family phosphatase [Candidatus Dependentiae bacterium]